MHTPETYQHDIPVSPSTFVSVVENTKSILDFLNSITKNQNGISE